MEESFSFLITASKYLIDVPCQFHIYLLFSPTLIYKHTCVRIKKVDVLIKLILPVAISAMLNFTRLLRLDS